MTGPDIVMYVIGGVLSALCVLAVYVTHIKEREQQRRYEDYNAEQERRYSEQLAHFKRAEETSLKGHQLIEETNRLLRELIDSHRGTGAPALHPSRRPSPPSDAGPETNTARGGEGESS